jgi:dienelactone hydrolase
MNVSGSRITAIAIATLGMHPMGVQMRRAPELAAAAAPATVCSPAVFLTFESGRLEAVNWVERRGDTVHTRSVLTQSHVIDATIQLRPDETAIRSSVILLEAGAAPQAEKTRNLGDDAIYWSDMVASSVGQAVARARVMGQRSSHIPASSMFSDTRGEVLVDRLDDTGWVVTYHNKRYDVLTDDQGCLIAATLPDAGTTIERRAEFAAERYPLWPPYAAPPDGAYQAREVTISAPQGHALAGTLTMPPDKNAVPAAVLITGLSPAERNGGQPPWMPLRDLSDILTRAGIAVLRVDDRGVGKSTGDHAPSTTFDEADDVQTEVAWLRTQPRIDPKRVALVGYSEGGLIAPMVAARDRSIAAIVTLAGPGVPGAELARYQVAQPVIHDPSVPASEREREIEKKLAEALTDLTARERVMLTIDPLPFARDVHCPALIIQGGNDLHVPMRSAERLAAAIRENGNADVIVRIFPQVSHSLLPDPVGLSSGWVFLPGFITSPEILDTLSDWAAARLSVQRRFRKSPSPLSPSRARIPTRAR